MEKQELIVQLLKNIRGSRISAAECLGWSVDKFNRHQYEHKGSRFFTLDELLKLQTLSGTSLVAEFFARKAGCVVVTKPQAELIENIDLHRVSMLTHKLRGDVDAIIIESIANGGYINAQEEKRILNHHEKHIAHRDFEVKSTLMKYKKQSSGCWAAQS